MAKIYRKCDSCYADGKEIKADYVNPNNMKYGEALCKKCYKEVIDMYKNFKEV